MDSPYTLIATPDALAARLDAWAAVPWLAVDTEFVREDTYYAQLCLVQLSDGATHVCVDTLALSQWIQWMLIPRMRAILAGEGSLPTRSAIHPYAEDCFEHLDDPTPLLLLIERFDGLIRGEAVSSTH